jgi:hypothetical protein
MDDAEYTAPPSGNEPIILGAPGVESYGGGDYIGEIDMAPPATSYGDYDPSSFAEPNVQEDALPAVMTMEPPAEQSYYVAPGVEEVAEETEDSPADDQNNELSPMAVWNNQWQITLKERKDEENMKKGEQVEKAEKQVSEFQAQREKRREARISKNRAEEQEKLEAIEADLENDNSWQRVVKMVELNQDAAEQSKDCSRMRDVLILLKNDPDRAAILA